MAPPKSTKAVEAGACLCKFVLVHRINPRFGWLLLLLAGLLAGGVMWQFHRLPEVHHASRQTEAFRTFMQQRESAADSILQHFAKAPCTAFGAHAEANEKVTESARRAGIALFRYDAENLLYWSDNTVPVGLNSLRERSDSVLWKLKNGWYLVRRKSAGGCMVAALALVRTEYSYQNDYLHNHFPDGANLPDGARLSEVPEAGALKYATAGNRHRVWFIPDAALTHQSTPGMFALLLLALVLLVSGGHLCWAQSGWKGRLAWWLALMALRWISFQYAVPVALYASAWFNPAEYGASNWLPSLGDLMLNALLLLYTAVLFRNVRIPRNRIPASLLPTLVFAFLFAYGWFTLDLLRGLIINSSISLNINDFLSLSASSFVAFLIIGTLFGTFFLWASTLLDQCRQWEIPPKVVVLSGILASIVLSVALPFWGEEDVWMIPGVAVLLLSVYAASNPKRPYSYTAIIGLLALFSLVGTVFILRYSSRRELEKRQLLAVKVAAEQDPIAESLFLETEKQIRSDTLIRNYLRPSTKPSGPVRDLGQLYFNGYWEKYNINVHVFGADECLMTALYASNTSDPVRYDRLIDSIGIMTLSEHFYFLDNNSGRISYIARLPIYDIAPRDSALLGTLYIEFNSRYTPEEIGYPELLLDKMVSSNTDLSRYSYARYTQQKLVSHFGSYPYSLEDSLFQKPAESQFITQNLGGFQHLIHRPHSSALVVLSLPEPGLLEFLTPFSYLMLFFGILVLLPFAWRVLQNRTSWREISFKRRIQLSIILILFLSLLLIGGGTLAYIISNNTRKNHRNLSEKVHSVLVETEYLLGSDSFLDPAKAEDFAYALTRQANVFFADINVFTPSGLLYASSRPKVFDEGLVSRKMDPIAYQHLLVEQSTEYMHQEQIGRLSYLSAYVPLRNTDNKVVGYLNLPYFARQGELQREIATFVVAIINIYVLLIVLVLIAAIIISNTITEPLRIIQERLATLRLGRKNEAIAWKGHDEIAALIEEYNRMVSELAASAEKLARSERESAWREMAKQVAHEIKNPLTPMKLSTQMLKRAWDDQAPGFEQRLERFTHNLIEQIDALSHIATEFSNFAKMPKMTREKVDLYALLESAKEFHQGEGGVNIHFASELAGPCFIHTDKEQMLRVFNNLIRNAVQAIPEGQKGAIRLQLQGTDSGFHVRVSDNGTGIDEAVRDKIFSPNFTTKNAGMGLGLALVKNIVESSGGQIYFETEQGQGTTFHLDLPSWTETEPNTA